MINKFKEINNFGQLIKITLITLIFVDIFYMIIFKYLNIPILVLVKELEAVSTFLVIVFLLKKHKYHNLLMYFTHLCIFVSCISSTYVLSSKYGFIIVMIVIISLGYVNNFQNKKYPLIIGLLEALITIIITIITYNTEVLNIEVSHWIFWTNLIFMSFIVVYFSYLTNIISNTQNETTSNNNQVNSASNLLSRNMIKNIINNEIDLLNKQKIKSLGIILIEVDNFESINEESGYSSGDFLIKSTSLFLKNITIKYSSLILYVSRWSNKEFLICIQNISQKELREISLNIKNEFAKIKHSDGYINIETTLSLGASLASQHTSFDSLLCSADNALLSAKTNGNNNFFLKVNDV